MFNVQVCNFKEFFILLRKLEIGFLLFFAKINLGWSGDAMVLGKIPVPGRPTIWITVGQGPTALAVGAGEGCLDIFLSSITSLFFLLSLGDSSI